MYGRIGEAWRGKVGYGSVGQGRHGATRMGDGRF
jgi:hypothetical protein